MKHYRHWLRQRGVTLIELMIVVVIVAILAGIAIPGYRQYVIRVKRTDATRELLSLAQRFERCFSRTNNYTTIDGAGTACVTLPSTTADGTYRIENVVAPTNNTFSIRAVPLGAQARDTKCASFTLNQLGAQNVTGTSAADPKGCWGGRGG